MEVLQGRSFLLSALNLLPLQQVEKEEREKIVVLPYPTFAPPREQIEGWGARELPLFPSLQSIPSLTCEKYLSFLFNTSVRR